MYVFGRAVACGFGTVLGVALGVAVLAGATGMLRPTPNLIGVFLQGEPDDMARWRRMGEPEPEPEPESEPEPEPEP